MTGENELCAIGRPVGGVAASLADVRQSIAGPINDENIVFPTGRTAHDGHDIAVGRPLKSNRTPAILKMRHLKNVRAPRTHGVDIAPAISQRAKSNDLAVEFWRPGGSKVCSGPAADILFARPGVEDDVNLHGSGCGIDLSRARDSYNARSCLQPRACHGG